MEILYYIIWSIVLFSRQAIVGTSTVECYVCF